MELGRCLPPLWARDGHSQTILSYFIPAPEPPGGAERVEIPLPDGDRLVGFLREGPKPVVVSWFHGLAGCTDSRYMRRAATLCARLGFTSLLANHRGCGPGQGLARAPYHSGRGEDIAEVIRFARSRYPRHLHIAVGFSLSGNALLLLLAGRRGDVPPDRAIAVNAPIRLATAARKLREGLNRLYDGHFTRLLRRSVLAREAFTFPRRMTLMDFDSLYTAPAGGFRDRDDYYASCSALHHLDRISVPTILLTSEDDPFVDYRDYAGARLSPSTRLHLEPHGGHMGYLTRRPTAWGGLHWLDEALAFYLLSLSSS